MRTLNNLLSYVRRQKNKGKKQLMVDLPGHGYATLRPTKGWATFSDARVRRMTHTNMLKHGVNPAKLGGGDAAHS